jgi:S1-C subfamily serine protease
MTRALALFALVLVSAPAPAQFSIVAARRSAVWVVTPNGTGSGFLLDRQRGLFVTAHHVIRDKPTVRVVFPEYRGGQLLRDRQWYRSRRTTLGIPAKVVRYSRERDLALVQVANPTRIPTRARPVRLAESEPQPGNRIHLISGVPTTRPTAFAHISGRVLGIGWRTSITRSGSVRSSRARREIHSTMPSRGGNSGAGVIDNRGELVGVHVAGMRGSGIGVSVVVGELRPFLLGTVGTFPGRAPRSTAPKGPR